MTIPPSSLRAIQYDNFIKSVKNGQGLALGVDNLKTIFDLFIVLASHTEQASLLNWVINSDHFTKVGTPTFATDIGWSTTSNLNRLENNLAFRSDLASLREDFEMGVFSNTDAIFTGDGIPFNGTINSSNSTFILEKSNGGGTGGRLWASNSSSLNRTSVSNNIGLISSKRINTSQYQHYKNGTLQGTYNITGASGSINSIYNILSPSFAGNHSRNTLSFAYIGKQSSINTNNLYNSIRDYLIEIGITGI